MEELRLNQLIDSLSQYLQALIDLRRCRMSTIKRSSMDWAFFKASFFHVNLRALFPGGVA